MLIIVIGATSPLSLRLVAIEISYRCWNSANISQGRTKKGRKCLDNHFKTWTLVIRWFPESKRYPQIIQVMDDHNWVLKPMVTCGGIMWYPHDLGNLQVLLACRSCGQLQVFAPAAWWRESQRDHSEHARNMVGWCFPYAPCIVYLPT